MEDLSGQITITPVRRRILHALLHAERPVTVRELSETLDIPPNTVTGFIKALDRLEALKSHRRDNEEVRYNRRIYYSVPPEKRAQLDRLMNCRQTPAKSRTRHAPLVLAVLRVLHEGNRPMYGHEIAQIMRLGRGMTYPRLRLLVDKGWATLSETAPPSRGPSPRIYYEITPTGRSVVSQLLKEEKD